MVGHRGRGHSQKWSVGASRERAGGNKTMRHMGHVMGGRGDMGAWHQHVGSMGMVGYRGRMGQAFWVDWLVVIIGQVVEYIAWVMNWRKTLCMWMAMKVVWHLGFVGCWHIIVRSWGHICRSMSETKD